MFLFFPISPKPKEKQAKQNFVLCFFKNVNEIIVKKELSSYSLGNLLRRYILFPTITYK